MNYQPIEMDRREAERMVDQYRREMRTENRERATAVDRLLLRAYKKLAAGQRLIDLADVMRTTTYDNQCRPRLAFARATASWCYWEREYWNDAGSFLDLPRAKGMRARHLFPDGTFQTWKQLGHQRQPDLYRKAKARVPLIPLHLRPRKAIETYFILFEAEWEPIPPKDPILLKQLHDNLYVVVAEWNLTAIERAVLQGMMRREES